MSDKPAVLVVDDDESFRSLVADRLTRTGHRTAAAPEGESALSLLEGVEVAVVDLLMPGMDGLAFLDALRRDARHVRLPVVVVTAKDLSPEEAERLGADGSIVLRKGDELTRELERVVGEVLVQRVAGQDAPRPSGGSGRGLASGG